MFPTGLPGIGLIAIRVTVAAMLLVDGSAYAAPQSIGCAIGSLVSAVCLVSGILTPCAPPIAGCLESSRLRTRANGDLFHFHLAWCVGLARGVLNTRPYSVDT